MSRSTKRNRLAPDFEDGEGTRRAKSPRTSQSFSTRASNGYTPASSASFDPSNRDTWSQLETFEDEPDMIDLTQFDDGPAFEFYGSFDTKIVGVRYYNGMASPGEVVICKREPSNPYDSNAIRVNNVFGTQIGHIPKTVAAKLAPYLDNGDVFLEAILTGEKGYYDCPIRLRFFGTDAPLARPQLEERLKKDRLVKATELKQTKNENELQRKSMGLKAGGSTAGLPSSSAELELSLDDLARVSQVVNLRSGRDFVKSLAIDEDYLSKMPMAKQPAILRATLLPYQLQGLAWLMAKENPEYPAPGSSDSVQLWKRSRQGHYTNVATNFATQSPPGLLSGGILGDDMGLGKTLQMISLIMIGGQGATLVVAPVSVMSNWDQQIRRHVLPEHAPKVLIYHGNSRQTSVKALEECGVVITSYGTLSSEENGGTLSKVNWRRVVLDEGHTIRNAKTKAAQAACQLEARSRWVLTGTPIINNIRDLQSLLKFLRITGGLELPEVFNSVIGRQIAFGDPAAETLLQPLMNDLCLRRKKDMKFVDLKLPPKTEYIHRITFWPDEKDKYDALLSEAQGALEQFKVRSKFSKKGAFQGVLERLLRLRQTCNHWTLCKERIENLMKLLEDETIVPLTDKNRSLLQQALQLLIESQEECAICMEPLSASPVITHCKHAFCRPCISKVIEIQGKCPYCRAPLTDDKLVEPAPENSADEDLASLDREFKSSKTEALLKILQATLKSDGSKVIIFSQWTSFLNVIQRQLDDAGYKYTRVDGSMNTAKRDAAIRSLDFDPSTRIMLASLAVCSVGLNLVSADTVVLADSWWAPAIEDQAVDRVHRLGQTRPTTVWRLVMEGTVEERVLDIQSEKRQLVTKAFQEKDGKAKKTKETRMADIQKLLG